jgi:hypothetical protein
MHEVRSVERKVRSAARKASSLAGRPASTPDAPASPLRLPTPARPTDHAAGISRKQPLPMEILSNRVMAGLFAAALVLAGPAVAAPALPACGDGEPSPPVVYGEEVESHRLFEQPVVSYPAGSALDGFDPYLQIAVGVDATGRPTCLDVDPAFAEVAPPEMRALIAGIAEWRYRPFERDGRAVPVRVAQDVHTQILPARRVPVPAIDADRFSVTLVRLGCFFGCPEYAVTVRGDGAVGYRGTRQVDVPGTHSWRVPAADVARLVAIARDPLLWSADDRYWAQATDQETTVLRIDAGGQRKQVVAYGGALAGMPVAIRRLQQAVDDVARTGDWTMLSHASLASLQREGFDFRSPAAGTMLQQALKDHRASMRDVDTSAVLRLLELGAPVGSPERDDMSPLEWALRMPHPALIEPLIARTFPAGELPSQAALDAAFAAAIESGRLEAVQRIWNVAGDRRRPSLEVVDPTNRDLAEVRRIPVVLLLEGRFGAKEGWEGFAIARWLADQGTALTGERKDGRTLLDIAAEARDAPFFLWLLERGLDPRPLGDTRLVEIGVRLGEDTALALLEAQVRRGGKWRLAPKYRFVAELQEWPRVLAWLDAHPEVEERERCGQAATAEDLAALASKAAQDAAAGGEGKLGCGRH